MFFKKKSLVAHIRLSGVIGNVGRFQQGLSYASHHEIIEKAFSLKKIKAVAITINSPGGSPVQSHLLYSLIRKLADEKKVKVITFAEDVAASGGYMLRVLEMKFTQTQVLSLVLLVLFILDLVFKN